MLDCSRSIDTYLDRSYKSITSAGSTLRKDEDHKKLNISGNLKKMDFEEGKIGKKTNFVGKNLVFLRKNKFCRDFSCTPSN